MSMLRPVPMAFFRAQVPNRDAAAATRAIAAEGLLHLVDIAHGRTPYDAAPPGVRELYAAFRDLVRRIRDVAERLDVPRSDTAGAINGDEITDFAAERERISALLEPLEKRVHELARRAAAARERANAARDAQQIAGRLHRTGVDVARLSQLRFAVVRLGIAPATALPAVSAVLSPGPHCLVPLDDELFAVAAPAGAKARVDEAMRIAVAQTVAWPVSVPAVAEIGDSIAALQIAEEALKDERAQSAEMLEAIARRAEIGMLLLQAQTHFAAAGRFLVISGWVPASSAERLRTRVRAATHDHAIIDIEAAENVAGAGEGSLRVPILHRNPLLLRPFQKLVAVYGTPSYGEVEPTAFFAVAFLLMFGLMFGDAGHGALLFTAGWFLFRYLPRFLDYGILLMEAGSASALFGVLYGTVFGIRGLIPTLWLEPIADLPRFMVIAGGLGVVVVTAGLVLNIVNRWRSGDLREAISGPKGITGALLYWTVLVILVRAFIGGRVRIPSGLIFALVGVVVVVLVTAPFIVRRLGTQRPTPPVRTAPWWLHALESSVELVDTLFSFFANTISFVRIAAFAAVHCGIFLAIFALADTITALPLGGVLSIAVHVAGNALVILLEGLTVSVQVLRLEYYEFFGKFFRGGGEPYAPLQFPSRRSNHA